jgi:hypothetical protein
VKDRDAGSEGKAGSVPHDQGWAISVPLEVGAIQECEEHGWMRDRADPHARERAVDIAREDPPQGVSPEKAKAAVKAS